MNQVKSKLVFIFSPASTELYGKATAVDDRGNSMDYTMYGDIGDLDVQQEFNHQGAYIAGCASELRQTHNIHGDPVNTEKWKDWGINC